MRFHRLIFLVFGFVLLGAKPGQSQSDPVSSLSQDPVWLKLGHYEKKTLGGYRSDVDEPAFFLSPEGRADPEKELRATLQAFQNTSHPPVGRLKQHPLCAFPARFSWLKKKLDIQTPHLDCSTREEWVKGLNAKSVTLVFSSAYPNNPASMFGHTLLRFNQDKGEAILNYGANFEAHVDANEKGIVYALKGLLGLYRGEFSLAPYYVKVNEYNFAESRDLWEYDLSLNQDEVAFLVSHLWELFATGKFSYLFLTRNCSYQLIALLEAAKPEWNLTHGFHLYALPMDTVKRVNRQAGAIVAERRRPSLHARLIAQIDLLSDAQDKARQDVTEGKQEASTVSDVGVLESAITTLDYKRRKQGGNLSAQDDALFRTILLRRASLGMRSDAQVEPQIGAESPLLTHESSMLLLGGMARNGYTLGTLGVRLSLHDLTDPGSGFPPGLQVEFGKLRLSGGSRTGGGFEFRLEELKILDILSLFPANSGELQVSWAVRIGSSTPIDFGRTDALASGLEAGPGIAASFSRKTGWIYALALGKFEWIPAASKSGRLGPGGEVGVSWRPLKPLSLLGKARASLELNQPWDRIGYWETEAIAAWAIQQNLQLRVSGKTAGPTLGGENQVREIGSELRWFL